jgi:hypothetical protein
MEAPVKPASPVERAVAALLVENTGAHFLDSGIYGRAWQVTRAKYGLDGGLPNSTYHGGPGHVAEEPQIDEIGHVALAMREEPEGDIDPFGCVSVDTFHWLVNRLDYDEKLDRKFRRFVDKLWAASRDQSGHTALHPRIEWPYETGAIERFIVKLREHGAHVHVDDSRNTYNGEDALDRTLQYVMFTVTNPVEWGDGWRAMDNHSTLGPDIDKPKPEFLPDGTYVALQVHGGADVRGGYTDAHLFTVPGYDAAFALYDNDRMEVWCEGADLVPHGQAPGQITMEAEILEPEHVTHVWDNGYGDGLLRRYDRDIGDQVEEVLCLPYREDERAELTEKGVIDTSYDPKNPKMFKANVGTYDDDAKVWRCPFDGSPLRASGACVG